MASPGWIEIGWFDVGPRWTAIGHTCGDTTSPLSLASARPPPPFSPFPLSPLPPLPPPPCALLSVSPMEMGVTGIEMIGISLCRESPHRNEVYDNRSPEVPAWTELSESFDATCAAKVLVQV